MSLLLLFQNRNGIPSAWDGSTTLFIHGHETVNNNCGLFVCGNETSFNSINLHTVLGTSSIRSLILRTRGFDNNNDIINLYIGTNNVYGNQNTPLYVYGYDVNTGEIPLHIIGGMSNNLDLCIGAAHEIENDNLDLYTVGHLEINNNLDLFIHGIFGDSREMNLFIRSDAPNSSYDDIDLSVSGGSIGIGQLGRGIDLFLSSAAIAAPMNLFISAPSSAYTEKRLNLYVKGEGYVIDGHFDLTCWNTFSNYYNNTTLYVQGEPVELDGTLNLFIKRMPSEMIPLFIQGPPYTYTDSMTLFTKAAYTETSDLNLALPNSVGLFTQSLQLYSHGF